MNVSFRVAALGGPLLRVLRSTQVCLPIGWSCCTRTGSSPSHIKELELTQIGISSEHEAIYEMSNGLVHAYADTQIRADLPSKP